MIMSKITEYTRIFENARKTAGRVDEAKTLKAWKARAVVTRGALDELRAEYARDVAAINAEYRPAAAAQRVGPLTEAFKDICKTAKEKMAADLEDVMAAKRQQLSKAQGAPSTDMVNLLTVLGMRTKLTAAEVAEAASKLTGNIPALCALRDISAKHDISFTDISVESMEHDLETAENFARGKIDTVDIPAGQMDYRTRLFWASPDGEAAYFFGKVDDGFTAALVEHEPTKESKNTPDRPTHERVSTPIDLRVSPSSSANAVRVFLRGDETAPMIAAQFGTSVKAIQANNPGKDMAHLRQGDELIVPSTSIIKTNTPGSVLPEQCLPIDAGQSLVTE